MRVANPTGQCIAAFVQRGRANQAPRGPLSNYKRLAKIKKQYDPANLFHVNQNIQPTS